MSFSPLLPWEYDDSIFPRWGWQMPPTPGIALLFEYLRVCPTYELARREVEGELSPIQRAKLPPDFDQVRSTYRVLGSVHNVLCKAWMIDRGIPAFGTATGSMSVTEVSFIEDGMETPTADVSAAVEDYLDDPLRHSMRKQGAASTMLVAVPIFQPRRRVLSRVAALLDARRADAVVPPPLMRFHGQRLPAKALSKGVNLLKIRAEHPGWELWRVGTKANLNPDTAEELDVNAGRSTGGDSGQIIDRARMTKSVSRDLGKYERIAENAARGRFPSDLPGSYARWTDETYQEIGIRLATCEAWERQEKARLLALRHKRDAAKARRA